MGIDFIRPGLRALLAVFLVWLGFGLMRRKHGT
jgi:hypothetical protein